MQDTARSEAGRQLAAARPRGAIPCELCGTIFTGYTEGKNRGRYCSRPCQQKGYRQTHVEQERARKREQRKRRGAASRQAGRQLQIAQEVIPPSPLDARLDRAHALAEAQWARAEGNLAEAERWERAAAEAR
jgi:hypothetical protein